ncbi:amino acid ABC transporter substrate-binding protein (PAAT family) [Haloactinopolyspora alba]|uniref:Amino acid ABC transporter substrate-binding protein (PAAT family) n=1 Tax=Haloactinopolyspora alba TaxID=648780 RepID=A0A2P8EB48_9ACTN|nr:transporter substrate-binding domain-containing protein [Haloactinopolyspora alba]PSL06667.1 amino acid ABC transporter substrate-binding protein (PAAT family) [Haloactinopolyspora alba]
MTTRTLRAVAASAAAVLLLTACGDDGESTTSDGGGGGSEFDLVQEGTLTVCSDIPYPPLEFQDPDSPSGYAGFDIELMQNISDNLGLEMAVKDVGFDALQSGTIFASGQCDIGASAMTILEERKENLDFSDPYYDSLQSLLAPVDSGIQSIDDLSGKTVGVQQGTTGQRFAQENLPDDANDPQRFPSDGELWPALQAGNIAAILQDYPPNYVHAQDNPDFEIVQTFETNEQYGFAFPKGEKTQLREAVNEELQALRDDGTYDELYAEYFPEAASASPSPS